MAFYAVFGIGIGNVGSTSARRPMEKWIEMLNQRLGDAGSPVRVIRSVGHTGNFVVSSPSSILEEVSAQFNRLLDTAWVVRSAEDVQGVSSLLSNVAPPNGEGDIRWTLGGAFHAGAGINFVAVKKAHRMPYGTDP